MELDEGTNKSSLPINGTTTTATTKPISSVNKNNEMSVEIYEGGKYDSSTIKFQRTLNKSTPSSNQQHKQKLLKNKDCESGEVVRSTGSKIPTFQKSIKGFSSTRGIRGILKAPPYRNPPPVVSSSNQNNHKKITPKKKIVRIAEKSNHKEDAAIKPTTATTDNTDGVVVTGSSFILWRNTLGFHQNYNRIKAQTTSNQNVKNLEHIIVESQQHISLYKKGKLILLPNQVKLCQSNKNNSNDNIIITTTDSSSTNKDSNISSTKYRANNKNNYIFLNPTHKNCEFFQMASSNLCEKIKQMDDDCLNDEQNMCIPKGATDGNDMFLDGDCEFVAGCDDILSKPEFTSSLFKNIPVRQRKGVPHMENYCLFDPSVDFINEKEILAKSKHKPQTNITENINHLSIISVDDDDLIEEIIYEDQLVYDPLFHQADEQGTNGLDEYPNYFVIEPENENQIGLNVSTTQTIEHTQQINSRLGDGSNRLNVQKTISHGLKKSPQIDKIFRQSSLPIKHNGQAVVQSTSVDNLRSSPYLISANSSQLIRSQNNYKTMPFDVNSSSSSSCCTTNSSMLLGGVQEGAEGGVIRRKPINRQRPISSYSDADSGFLSPNTSPDNVSGGSENRFNSAAFCVLEQCDSIHVYIEIYTDWANYYLDRAKSKKKVTDISTDLKDGLLLAEIIEAVTTFKVPDLIKKPKTQQQMYDNVNSCLQSLQQHGVSGVELITANDICAGRLKAILALFFALSRNRNQTKTEKYSPKKIHQQQQQPNLHYHQQQVHQPNASDMTNRQLPVSQKVGNGGTSIPLPATVLVTRRCQPDKVRPLPPTPGQQHSGANKNRLSSEDNSRPGSPPTNNVPSQIPKGGTNSLRQPQIACKIPASPYSTTNGSGNTPNGGLPNVATIPTTTTTKHSMLDKFKLFNKEKSDKSKSSQISKRTSSSSGFSSARSERSDSSLSLNSEQQQQQQAPPNKNPNKKSDSLASAKSSNKSKILSSTFKSTANNTTSTSNNLKSSSTSINKTDKKDKSPARKSNDEATLNSKLQKMQSSKIESKLKPLTGMKKPEVKPQVQPQPIPPNMQAFNKPPIITNHHQINSTGIPKPMAAIKGTSKIPLDRASISSNPKDENQLEIFPKNDKTCISSSADISLSSQSDRQTNVVIPMAVQQINNTNISMTDSSHSNSTHSASTGLNSNSSESSVIYRPSSESGSDILNTRLASVTPNPMATPPRENPIPNRKLKQFNDTMHMSPTGIEPQIINGKFHTVSSVNVMRGNPNFNEESNKQLNIKPMRPLLRGYTSHVTLPTRGMRGHGQHMVSEYYDDLGKGYMSDGESLRNPVMRFSDIDNGYMSEGGLSREGKHYLSILKGRTLLPTTIIEEKCRSSRGDSLDSVGLTPPAMETNGGAGRTSRRDRDQREQWTKYTSENHHQNGHQTPPSPTPGRKEKGSPSHARRSASSSKLSSSSGANGGGNSNSGGSAGSGSNSTGRTKHAQPNFGYVKRTNGTNEQPQQSAQQILSSGRTVHVSAVQRSNKIKVSGGTQTCSSDLQTKIAQNPQHRSFSLTGPGATQLSQSIRERLSTGSHSLPKPGTDLHVFQHRFTNRGSGKINDGSLSDTQTYAEVKPDYSTYAMWLKHSNTASSRLSAESDGLENMSISSASGVPRSLKFLHHRESTHSPRLNRSNSIRSTKSEKMYPSMLSRTSDIEIEPYYCLPVGTIQQNPPVPWSQPTSPTPPSRGFSSLLSPTHGNYRLTYPKKNDDVHGSAASLLSGGSSLYGSVEERQANEMRRLKRELLDAKDQVMTLSSQLSTNAHVVAAFEQSLTSMTGRLHQLTANAEKKDSELLELRQTIERLRKSSIQAGLTSAHMQSMGVTQPPATNIPNHHHRGVVLNSGNETNHATPNVSTTVTNVNGSMQRHLSTDSMCSLNSLSSGCSTQDKKKKKGWLRSSFTKAFSRNAKIAKTNRHINNTASSNNTDNHSGNHPPSSNSDSTLPPVSPNKSPHKIVTLVENAKPIDAIDVENNPVVEDLKKQLREKDLVLTDIRLEALSSASQLETLKDTVMRMRAEMMNLKQNNERLQKMVTSRSLAGSELSLGALATLSSGGSGIGGGGGGGCDNRASGGGGSSNGLGSPSGSIGEPRRYSLVDNVVRPPLELPKSLEETEEENIPPAPAPDSLTSLSPTTHIDLTPPPKLDVPTSEILSSSQMVEETGDTDGKRLAIAVYLGQPDSFLRYSDDLNECDNYYSNNLIQNNLQMDNFYDNNYHHPSNPYEFIIAFTYISGKTTWQNLDYIVRKTFKDYLAKIDPGTNLGLNTDSITSYHLGEAKRGPEMGFPELLPCGYIVGNVRTLYICLQGVGSLAFDSLIPKSIVQRYISLLNEHRRLILCGPSGTGKSYLARKLAEFLVARSGRGNITEAIACFNVDHKSSKDLRQYLTHIVEQASMANGASELPSVIILDNLHHTSGDVFSCLTGPVTKLPCIIGIMSQATCNTTNLQLHHNFRWVLTANHMEPVKGFLGRFLRRRLYLLELSTNTPQLQLAAVFAWLPTVWQHINRFLETHSSSDVTIGPRLFLSCPLEIKDSQVWFTDVWNYHLAPYLVEAVREGVQLYGRRGGAWVDPSTYIKESYPWPQPPAVVAPLRHITSEDVGLESDPPDDNETQDPLLNMLLRLQEAANYADKDGQESDCASLDSNITQDSSAEIAE